jgi:3-oxoacyl-[acyl-carrier-protein] synthase III
MKQARITAIDYHLPESILTNDELARRFPEWPAQKILDKTGISERHIATENETATDLAVKAARALFSSSSVEASEVDFVILCTQGPDYFLPASACVVQSELGIPTTAGAIDINQGCSGYVYSLSLAHGLISGGTAQNVLVLTADTYSKYLKPDDKSVLTIFGDGAAATLVQATDEEAPSNPWIGPFELGTDGTGAEKLIVRNGGMRNIEIRERPTLVMDGSSIFSFSLKTVPRLVSVLLEKANLTYDDIDRFVFHQANLFMIETLRRQMKIPQQKFVIDMRHKGNTVSSTIPIALKGVLDDRKGGGPEVMLLVGFGVGLSWGAVITRL